MTVLIIDGEYPLGMDSNGDHAILTMAANPGYRVPHTIIQLECFLSSPEDILPLLFREKGRGRERANQCLPYTPGSGTE